MGAPFRVTPNERGVIEQVWRLLLAKIPRPRWGAVLSMAYAGAQQRRTPDEIADDRLDREQFVLALAALDKAGTVQGADGRALTGPPKPAGRR
jgi:hypothetical protein